MNIVKNIILKKMDSYLNVNNKVEYTLYDLHLNNHFGKVFKLTFNNKIVCSGCKNLIKKSFPGGFCFKCYKTLAICDICIIKPHLCHFYKETCRDPVWGKIYCINKHYVYLANTGKIKVGITRKKNVPYRWIDQGAIQALPIIEVRERLIAGLIETKISKYIHDKTYWKKMLEYNQLNLDLLNYKKNILNQIQDYIQYLKHKYGTHAINILNVPEQTINYPIMNNSYIIKSFNLNKQSLIVGKFLGIKGQYILLNTGVLNMRKFIGYECYITLY